MARTRSILGRALAIYLLLPPLLGSGAGAQQAPRPFDPQPPDGQPAAPGESLFTPIADTLTIRAPNGFQTEAIPGYFSHHRHSHDGGLIRVDSPWGERLAIRYWLTPRGVTFEYDDDLKVRYRFDGQGTLTEIEAESPFRQATMPVGDRARRVRRGELEPSSLDLSAYEVIEEAMRAKHSAAFLDGMAQQQGLLGVSCSTKIIQCAACIVAWANTVPAIAAACIVGGVPTFGTACLLAILAHEAAGFACAVTCIDAVAECRGQPHTFPVGCEP